MSGAPSRVVDADGEGYQWSAFPEGARGALSAAGAVMAASFVGFGGLARTSGYDLEDALLFALTIWALPGQALAVDLGGRGAPLAAVALAVSISAVRLMPITMIVLSQTTLKNERRAWSYLLAHFIAVTIWALIGERVRRGIVRARRLPWLMGAGVALVATMLVMTAFGYALAARIPPLATAAMTMLTPSFFLIALLASAASRGEHLAIVFGAAIAFMSLDVAPGVDLIIAGAVGGTLAWIPHRMRRRKRPLAQDENEPK